MISKFLGFDSDYIILGLAAFCIILFIIIKLHNKRPSRPMMVQKGLRFHNNLYLAVSQDQFKGAN